MTDRVREVIDISHHEFIRTAMGLVKFMEELEKRAPTKLYFETWLNNSDAVPEPGSRDSLPPPEKTPAEFMYASGHLVGYRNTDTEIIVQLNHVTGHYCALDTNEAVLTVSGPNKRTVDDFVASLPLESAKHEPTEKPHNH